MFTGYLLIETLMHSDIEEQSDVFIEEYVAILVSKDVFKEECAELAQDVFELRDEQDDEAVEVPVFFVILKLKISEFEIS